MRSLLLLNAVAFRMKQAGKEFVSRLYAVGFHFIMRDTIGPHLEYGVHARSPNVVAGVKHLDRIQRYWILPSAFGRETEGVTASV